MATKASKTHGERADDVRTASRKDGRIPEIGLGRLLREADLIFNRALRDELAGYDVTFSQYQHLWQLWKEDNLAQFELSRRIGIENSSSTAAIDQLEQRGLINRHRDPKDRRRVIVTLTPAGRKLEHPLNECAIVVNRRARANISPEEIATLFDTITKITRNFGRDKRPGRSRPGERLAP
jgi:MarR family transcriptional regulator, organic hydroperoxide resistance regulator